MHRQQKESNSEVFREHSSRGGVLLLAVRMKIGEADGEEQTIMDKRSVETEADIV